MYFQFGKYKGWHIDDVPSTYLAYAIEEFSLTPDMQEAIKNELSCRFATNRQLQSSSIRDAYRRISKKYHPDVGGSHEAMQAINEFYELIRAS